MSFDWRGLGEDDGGLPIHMPMPCNERGQGPVLDRDALSYRCWCPDPECLLTRELANAWQSGVRWTTSVSDSR